MLASLKEIISNQKRLSMQKSNYLYDLFKHMQWADATVWQAILKTNDADKDGKIKGLTVHIHMVHHAYLCLWEKLPLKMPGADDFKDLQSVAKWGNEFYEEIFNFLNCLEEDELDNLLEIPWIKYFESQIGKVPNAITIGESLLQVALHSTYHRGQVNTRLRELGGEPPLVDYLFWILQSRPEGGRIKD
jgi:uncharacterized damage-inducible protein DinB